MRLSQFISRVIWCVYANRHRLSALETYTLDCVVDSLGSEDRQRLLMQLHHVNRVQRFLRGREVNLYVMRGSTVSWPENVLFDDRSVRCLATVELTGEQGKLRARVFIGEGHIFSIEFDRPVDAWNNLDRVDGANVITKKGSTS
jgi:hypothetical protein